VLLHYVSNLPVFLNDPTCPHDNTVTLAHCTAPRKMNGRKLEPVKILTRFESDYGAAPKVEMKLGLVCTNLVPDFASKKWVGGRLRRHQRVSGGGTRAARIDAVVFQPAGPAIRRGVETTHGPERFLRVVRSHHHQAASSRLQSGLHRT
jgi:hypothetical protein